MKILTFCTYSILLAAVSILSGCSSSSSPTKVDVTPPPVPNNLEITHIGEGSVSLSWSPVLDKGLKGYKVYWLCGSQADTLFSQNKIVTIPEATISGLNYNSIYYFAVTSIDKSNNESALSSQTWGIPGNLTPPDSPKNVDLVAENIYSPKITVFWAKNMNTDFSHYNVYRAPTAIGLEDSLLSYLTSVIFENYIDINVKVDSTYFYRIKTVDKGGFESEPSSYVSDIVLQKVTLISPLNFIYVSATPEFKWNPVPGAKKYNMVIINKMIGGEIWNIEVDEYTTEITYYGKTNLINEEKYYWRVGAISRKEINSASDINIGSFTVLTQ